MRASRITAVGLVAAAALWIGSGHLLPRDSAEGQAAIRPAEQKALPAFEVSVATARVMPHSPTLTLSGRTEADHRVTLSARTGGVLTQLLVQRGQHVKRVRSLQCCRTKPARRRLRRRWHWLSSER